jgi:hypothetical protein
MKYLSVLLLVLCIGCETVGAQVKNDDRMWTIWFTVDKPSKEFAAAYDRNKCLACDSIKNHPRDEWVQSFFDSSESYEYYWHLRSTGKVLMWGEYECGVDTASVWIDEYSLIKRDYLKIKQPSKP